MSTSVLLYTSVQIKTVLPWRSSSLSSSLSVRCRRRLAKCRGGSLQCQYTVSSPHHWALGPKEDEEGGEEGQWRCWLSSSELLLLPPLLPASFWADIRGGSAFSLHLLPTSFTWPFLSSVLFHFLFLTTVIYILYVAAFLIYFCSLTTANCWLSKQMFSMYLFPL